MKIEWFSKKEEAKPEEAEKPKEAEKPEELTIDDIVARFAEIAELDPAGVSFKVPGNVKAASYVALGALSREDLVAMLLNHVRPRLTLQQAQAVADVVDEFRLNCRMTGDKMKSISYLRRPRR